MINFIKKMFQRAVLRTVKVPITINSYQFIYPEDFWIQILKDTEVRVKLYGDGIPVRISSSTEDSIYHVLNSLVGFVKYISPNDGYAQLKVLNTSHGRIVNELIKQKVPLILHPCGVGNLYNIDGEDKAYVDMSTYSLIALDLKIN